MGGEDDYRALGDVPDILNEVDASLLEAPDDPLVMHDGMTNVKRCAVNLQSEVHNLDRIRDAGTKAARRGEKDFLHCLIVRPNRSRASDSRKNPT